MAEKETGGAVEAKPSEGEWAVCGPWPMTIDGNVYRVLADGYPVAFIPAWDKPGPGEIDGTEEARANARVVGAAKRMAAALDEINLLACYASEENIDAREEILLAIGKAARAALQPVIINVGPHPPKRPVAQATPPPEERPAPASSSTPSVPNAPVPDTQGKD